MLPEVNATWMIFDQMNFEKVCILLLQISILKYFQILMEWTLSDFSLCSVSYNAGLTARLLSF